MKIKCPNNGCNITPDYSDYLSHLEKCNYRLYHCGNKDCRYTDILSKMKLHVDKCKYRLVYCIYCSKNIKYYQKKGHDNVESKEIIKCNRCKVEMTKFEYYNNHYSENNNNICCLKDQVKYWKNKYNKIYNKYIKEIEEAEKVIDQLLECHKKEVNKYENKIKELKDQIHNNNNYYCNSDFSNSQVIYDDNTTKVQLVNIGYDLNKEINKDEYINIIFNENHYITSIKCHPDELLSDVIEKYKAKSSDHNIENKKWSFNAKILNLSLTVREAGLTNCSRIFVIN